MQPAAPIAAPGPVPDQRGLSLRYAYGAIAVLAVLSAIAQRIAHWLDAPDAVRVLLAGSTAATMLGTCIVGCVWVQRAWASLRAPTDMSSNEAALRLLIPVYGLYWMFAVQARLCAMLDARLAARGSTRAPRSVAMLAAVATLVCWGSAKASPEVAVASLCVSEVAWYAYMSGVDRLRAGLRGGNS